MANPNTNTTSWSELTITTLKERENQIIDNFTNKNELLKRMKKRGNIKKHDGGEEIVKNLFYQANGTYQRYSGYDTLDITPQETITAANFSWKQSAINVSMSGRERRINSGSNAIFNLLEERINNALMSFDNEISSDIYSAGSLSNQIGGLQHLVADDPTTGVVGGINRANYSFWQNYKYDASSDGGAAANSTNIQNYMNNVWLNTKRGSDVCDLIVASNDYWLHYLESLQSIQRVRAIDGSDGGAGQGGVLSYFGADVIADGGSGISTSHMYFLNTNYLFFEVHSDAFMTPDDEKMSVNQDAMVIPIYFMGNMTTNNAARQGVLIA